MLKEDDVKEINGDGKMMWNAEGDKRRGKGDLKEKRSKK